jgi:DNA modification methylase
MTTRKNEMWELCQSDCIPHMMRDMQPQSIDAAIFSPPFPSMYAYTDSAADLGNVDSFGAESRLHFGFLFSALRRVIKPGRVMVVHCCQIPAMKRTGEVGMHDFRGILIRIAQRAGFIYEYDWAVRKNPQSQAIRTRSRELQFAGLESDRAKSRGAIPDYLIKFRQPGENTIPIDSANQVSRNQWIEWAEPAWMDIRETDTLNTSEAKGDNDTRHICPLQLGVIERLILLYSNPDEIIFSPFAGIGSEGVSAIKHGRQFYGCELKPEYYEAACRNLDRAVENTKRAQQEMLF